MFIVRSPLRVSLGGGGTDLPSYYKENEGFLIAAAIDKYVYVNVMRPFKEGVFLKYSQLESVEKIEDVRHPIIKECLKFMEIEKPQIEITTLADIPSGTGLGSSGSFTTALLKALYYFQKKLIHPQQLAELACQIEIEKLGEPIGKQDQYAAAYGGITSYKFNRNGSVEANPLKLSAETIVDMEDNLMLFFTGFSRSAGSILQDQKNKTLSSNNEMLKNLHYVKELGYQSKIALEQNNVQLFGEIMNEHWEHKKRRSGGMTNEQINKWYDIAIRNGAIGGKLVGAGGGGFLMFYAKDRNKLRYAMGQAGLEEVRFRFDFDGTKTIMT